MGGITTGLRKLDSMGKWDLKNTMKALKKKKLGHGRNFSYFFLGK